MIHLIETVYRFLWGDLFVLPIAGGVGISLMVVLLLTAGVFSCVIVQPWTHMPALDAAGVEALAVFVVIGSFFAYMLYMQGVKDIGSVRASLIGTVEPVSATITSAVMLGTVFLPTDLIGFAMIIVMMFLTV